MQALCQWEVQLEETPESLRDFFVQQEAPRAAAVYAKELVTALWNQRPSVDGLLESAANKWKLSRIEPVERNVMRVAVVELLGDRVPVKAVLDEAIEISREYGGAQSPAFVNGVLDQVVKSLAKTPEGGD